MSHDSQSGDLLTIEGQIPDPTNEKPLIVVIQSLTAENNQIKFHIAMKTILPQYKKTEATVKRSYQDFINLLDIFKGNQIYDGIIIPPYLSPFEPEVNEECLAFYTKDPNPDGELQEKMTKELRREYASSFNNSLFHYCRFLDRIAVSPSLRIDKFFMEFITQKRQINLKIHNSMLGSLFKGISKQINSGLALVPLRDIETDKFFEVVTDQINYESIAYKKLLEESERMIFCDKRLSVYKAKLGVELINLNYFFKNKNQLFLLLGNSFEFIREIELSLPITEDLYFIQTIKYHHNMSTAIKSTLETRMKAMRARKKTEEAYKYATKSNTDVGIASEHYLSENKRFERVSDTSKEEINLYNQEKISMFQKNFTKYCEAQIENTKKIVEEISRLIEILSTQTKNVSEALDTEH